MSIDTQSRFIYGFEVSADALYIDFDEGAGELTAQLDIGSYSMTDFAAELARAINAVGALTYTVSVNRNTRIFTIAASGVFTLRVATGSHLGTTAYGLAGFTGADVTGSATYDGDSAAGSEYVTQFVPQSYVAPENFKNSVYATVNESASGKVEVVTFGEKRYFEMDLKFINDYSQPANGPIRNNPTGIADLQALMNYLTTKGPFEFMPDTDDTATFTKVFLESTQEDPKGLNYKLKEQYGRGLPGFFDTGTLKFRVMG